MLKLLGKKLNRSEERFAVRSLGASEFFLVKLKLGLRRLSVEGLGVASPLSLGKAFFMLTGGYLRSLFSFCTGAAAGSVPLEERLLLLRPSKRSPILPRVLGRL